MEVEILSRKWVKPSVPTSPHLMNLNISFLDQMASLQFVPLLLYYPNINNGDIASIRDRLEKSLSDVLTYYYPLAGRFLKKDLLVNCNDKGVDYVEARVKGSVNELIQSEKRLEKDLLHNLVPATYESDFETTHLAAIQVNIFECGGLVIVFSISHKVADGATAGAFINAWATASREGIQHVRQPTFELGSLIPARKCLPQGDSVVDIKGIFISKRFLFDSKSITSLKEKATSPHLERPPTRMEVVSAVIWRAFLVATQARHGHLRPCDFVNSVSLRGKTVPPISGESFGNFYAHAIARFKPDESKLGLNDLVELIRNSVRKTIDDFSKNLDGDEFITEVHKNFQEVQGHLSNGEEKDVLMFSSLLRFPLYEIDFGWGKPTWTSGIRLNWEMVSLWESLCDSGIEVYLCLNEATMLCFEKDKDIVAFTNPLY